MKQSLSPAVKFTLFIAALLIFAAAGKFFHLDLETVKAWFSDIPLALSGLIFVAVYIVLTNLVWFGPKDVLRVAAAVIFGAYISTFLIWLGELGNAAALFTLSRRMGREYVKRKFQVKNDKLSVGQRHGSLWAVFVLKQVMFIPLRILDLSFGLTSMSLKKYLFVSAIALPLRIFVLQFVLAGVGEVMLKEPLKAVPLLTDYLTEHYTVLLMSFGYIVFGLLAMGMFVIVDRRRGSTEPGA
jgi:uncharacterized membrane protein YdjX (TVP38/TMEM64 family)